jgi:DNA segregation ATPase FtsK/SpoIIIE, S-DNA-T family
VTAFHTVRTPLYLTRHAVRSPKGLGVALHRTWHWVSDREGHPLRIHAVESRDPKQYAVLARIRKERVRRRLVVLGLTLAALAIVSGVVSTWPPGRWVLLAGLLGTRRPDSIRRGH